MVEFFLIIEALLLIISSHKALAFSSNHVCLSAHPFKNGNASSRLKDVIYGPTALHFGDFFNGFGESKTPSNQEPIVSEVAENEKNTEFDEYYDEDDPIEKMFRFFFGKKEKNPMGMARFGRSRFVEQYPATVDQWADALDGDSAEVATLRPFMKNTNLERRPLRLTFDAKRDGWNASTFHAKVDRQGAGIIFATTSTGIKFGGYNPKGWVGYGEARGSIAAFLFVLNKSTSKESNIVPGVKLRKVGGPGLAQMDLPESGPSFSPDALVIPLGQTNSRLARSKLGSYYEKFPDGTNSLFGQDSTVQLIELKAYHGVYEEGEFIPFTDAEPFALY